jgi:hypothetical protein
MTSDFQLAAVSPVISSSSGLRGNKTILSGAEWPFPCTTIISGVVRALRANASLLRYNLAVIKTYAIL